MKIAWLLFFSKSNLKNNISYLVIGGLSVSFSLQILAQTTPTTASSSATLQATGIASNGMKYTDMANMSPAEMDKLSPQLQAELEAWMEKQVSQGKETVVSLDQWIKQGKETVVSKRKDGENIDKAAIEQATKEWAEIQPMLASLSKDKVIEYFTKDKDRSIRFLQYVVDNKLPPPGYAANLISVLQSVSFLHKK